MEEWTASNRTCSRQFLVFPSGIDRVEQGCFYKLLLDIWQIFDAYLEVIFLFSEEEVVDMMTCKILL